MREQSLGEGGHTSPEDAAAERQRVRVALVAGARPTLSNDFDQVLRKRLLVLSAFVGGSVAFLIVTVFLRSLGSEVPPDYFALLVSSASSLLLCLVNSLIFWFLWRNERLSAFWLRIIELIVIAPLAFFLLLESVANPAYEPLEWAAKAPSHLRSVYLGRYINAGSLLWFIAITAYGTLIPNSLRRAALMSTLIAISPIATFFIWANWVRPLPPDFVREICVGLSIANVLAVVLVLLATSRVEYFRKQASTARMLGQYLLKSRIGVGGMGEVYLAEHLLLRRPCALKTIRPERSGSLANLRRFEREVQTTATLTHPNTIQVFDYGHAEDGTFYYVMEYLPGQTLDEIVGKHGPLPPARVVYFLRQICSALREAHGRGLTHRDIKPSNIMICERGGTLDVVKVLDFGLVAAPKFDADEATLTQEGSIAGTPAYMSPEQASGQRDVGPRSDIYSVGALAYELLTGKSPFAGRTAAQMMAAHIYESPRTLPQDIPTELAEVVMRCLAKSPDDRWPEMGQLEEVLLRVPLAAWSAAEATAWWQSVAAKNLDRPRGDVATATYERVS